MNMEHSIYEVVIPMEDVMEFKNGKKVVVQKKVFPATCWCAATSPTTPGTSSATPRITGSSAPGPSPLPPQGRGVVPPGQAEGEEGQKRGKPRLEYEINENVRVKEGPFADFTGQIVEINGTRLRSRSSSASSAGRPRSSSGFSQVAKL